MERSFWLERWAAGQIGFHSAAVNPALVRHHDAVLAGHRRVLVPLCGKSLDLWWLRDQGHEVVGVELSEHAVRALFEEAGVTPAQRVEGPHTVYSAEGLTVFQGDLFDMSGRFDALWDRAALVALPAPMRTRYAQHIQALVHGPGLLVTFDYQQERRGGPPFSVSDAEVRGHYARVRALETLDISAEMRGRGWEIDVLERVYALDL